jgi:hypothetical protein
MGHPLGAHPGERGEQRAATATPGEAGHSRQETGRHLGAEATKQRRNPETSLKVLFAAAKALVHRRRKEPHRSLRPSGRLRRLGRVRSMQRPRIRPKDLERRLLRQAFQTWNGLFGHTMAGDRCWRAGVSEFCSVQSRDGTVIGFQRLGNGPPLAPVHGAALDRRPFSRVRAGLAERFTVHIPDLRGRGLSTSEGGPTPSNARARTSPRSWKRPGATSISSATPTGPCAHWRRR